MSPVVGNSIAARLFGNTGMGLKVVDTAECHTDSEEKLARALREKPRQGFLFTKCGHAPPIPPAGLVTRAGRKLGRPIGRAFAKRWRIGSPGCSNAVSIAACAAFRPIGST